jgi:hypothetical protein
MAARRLPSVPDADVYGSILTDHFQPLLPAAPRSLIICTTVYSTSRCSMRYARTMCRTISATTATSDASGTPALTASRMIDGRSDLNMTDSVIPKLHPCKPTLRAIADRKFSTAPVH